MTYPLLFAIAISPVVTPPRLAFAIPRLISSNSQPLFTPLPLLTRHGLPLTGRNPNTLLARPRSASGTLYSYLPLPDMDRSTRYTPCCTPRKSVSSSHHVHMRGSVCDSVVAYLSNLFALGPTHSSALEGVGFSDISRGGGRKDVGMR